MNAPGPAPNSAANKAPRLVYKRGGKTFALSLEGLNLGPATSWLPGVAAFLCLAMFAMAALVLLDVNADPKSPEAANVAAVSAQGFSGLRRVLEASGFTTALNRFEDGPDAEHGNLEVITLDSPGFYDLADSIRGETSDSADTSVTSAEASSEAAAEASEAAAESSAAAVPGALDGAFGASPKESNHMLYRQLGQALLVVAPKWQANVDMKNTRWATDPALARNTEIRDMLAELSPMREVATQFDKDGKPISPKVGPGEAVFFNGSKTVIYDQVPYVISHGKPASQLILKGPGLGELKVGKIDSLQSITGPNLMPILLGPNGEAILSRVIVTGGRKPTSVPVYLLSDPDLLNNQILSDPQKVLSAISLIEAVTPKEVTHTGAKPSKIVFNLVFSHMGFDHDLLHALSRPPYIGIPLSVLVLGLGLMWAAFARFGPAQELALETPLGRGVRVLADNAARLMAMTLKETKLAPLYADMVRDQVLKARSNALAGAMSVTAAPDELAERIGQIHKTKESFSDLKAQSAKVLTVHQLIDLTRRLHAWKTEINGANN